MPQITRAEVIAAGEWLQQVYQTELLRPEGLWIDGHPDWEGLGAWWVDTYYKLRLAGQNDAQAKEAILGQIRGSREWKDKHSVSPDPKPASTARLMGAFCIPKALYGDRIWWPNFLNEPEQRQDEMIHQTLIRNYNHAEIQVSGYAYPGYPEIPLDADLLRRGLQKLKAAGLMTMVAFRDDRGPGLDYLRPLMEDNSIRINIDWCMGIYECNGVFRDANIVLDVLKQARKLIGPRVKLGVHFTAQDPGTESHGLVDWQRAKDEAGLNAYLFQVSGWLEGGLVHAQERIADWTRRLQAGFHGYPILSDGVINFEDTTTKTFRDLMTEEEGVEFNDKVMNAPLAPDEGTMSMKPNGFCDGGTPY